MSRIPKNDSLPIDIKAGNVIIGLASYGQSSYETRYNSGIGSNGLTSARHDVLSKFYEENYPESFDPNTDESVRYCGAYQLKDEVHLEGKAYKVGDLLTSPTRTYLPVLHQILKLYKKDIQGIIHCTGGAQTKVMKFVQNKRVIKDNLLPIPPVFQLIQQEAGYEMSELYSVFNMGHRLEIYTSESIANEIMDIIHSFHIDTQIIGRVEESETNELIIESSIGKVEL